jgi:3-oxocholest-4-en-26-oate---CoA ligase
MGWTYAEVWETVADTLPDAPCLVQGARRRTWTEVDRRADGLAHGLVAGGLAHQDKVAQYLYNGPEYLESVYASFKASLVPVNTNYRYVDDELVYLWDNADAAAVVFHGSFAESCARVRDRVPKVKVWLWVDDGTGPCPGWSTPYESLAAAPPADRFVPRWGRSPDDLFLVYTGGTTGMPKGVMWRQEDLFLNGNRTAKVRYPADGSCDDVARMLREEGAGPVHVPVPPLMHATGAVTSFAALGSGGCIALLPSRSFDAVEALDVIAGERAASVVIIGDVSAKPLLDALDADPTRWDLSSVRVLSSTGTMWSAQVKERLSAYLPRAILVDVYGSSEAIGVASSIMKPGEKGETARFAASDDARVISEDGTRFLEPGSHERGLLARRGHTSLGYYKDDAKTATTVRMVDGQRWVVPGDWATLEDDGTITLLGRGSGTINSGGEKIFPEEVEEVLKEHASVRDVVVVGVPDDRFGETVAAVVEAEPGQGVSLAVLAEHARSRLAGYKVPRRLLVVPTLERPANGKVDRVAWQRRAADDTTA